MFTTSDSIKELSKALSKFQGEIKDPKKDGSVRYKSTQFDYATLGEILKTIRKPLSKNGLSIVQMPIEAGWVITRIMHHSGEWIQGSTQIPPKNNDPQGVGSVITYAKRYALCSLLGICGEDDDDGQRGAAKQNTKQTNSVTPVAERKAPTTEKEWAVAIAEGWYQIKQLDDYEGLINAIDGGDVEWMYGKLFGSVLLLKAPNKYYLYLLTSKEIESFKKKYFTDIPGRST